MIKLQYQMINTAFRNQAKFEHGIVLGVSDTGMVDGITGGRSNPRTKVGQAEAYNLKPGDRYISVGSGIGDKPVIFGNNPWITG
jgi:hypothetical protein